MSFIASPRLLFLFRLTKMNDPFRMLDNAGRKGTLFQPVLLPLFSIRDSAGSNANTKGNPSYRQREGHVRNVSLRLTKKTKPHDLQG